MLELLEYTSKAAIGFEDIAWKATRYVTHVDTFLQRH